jgi:hypothetical protein
MIFPGNTQLFSVDCKHSPIWQFMSIDNTMLSDRSWLRIEAVLAFPIQFLDDVMPLDQLVWSASITSVECFVAAVNMINSPNITESDVPSRAF